MGYGESYANAFPFGKMVSGMRNPEMIADKAKIMNEAIKEKVQVNLSSKQPRRRQRSPDRPKIISSVNS
jgi:hypothetical protein